MSKKKTTEEWIREATKIHKGLYDYSKSVYTGANQPITIVCRKHGDFLQNNNVHLKGIGCQKCSAEKQSKRFNETKNGTFFQKAMERYGDKYDLSRVNQQRYGDKIEIVCKVHNISFFKSPGKFLIGSGCPKCARSYSKGEERISQFLLNKQILFAKEKVLKGLPHKRYDFFLPEYNCCIEYHGKQHYEYNTFFHRKPDSFKVLQDNDILKKDFCLQKGIKYICIPYTEYENIFTILQKELTI